MLEIDFDNMISKDGMLKFVSIEVDKKGNYIKGKLLDHDIWVNLKVAKNDQQFNAVQNVIDASVLEWQNNQERDYIEISAEILQQIMEFDGVKE